MPILQQQRAYLNSISGTEEYAELLDYTKHNLKFLRMSAFLRTPSPKTFYELKEFFGADPLVNLRRYVDNINQIILNAPRSQKPVTVYRGTGDVSMAMKKASFSMKGFSGTSLKPEVAAAFADSTKCCTYRLILPPGTPFLFVGFISSVSSEYEVLLPLQSAFNFVRSSVEEINGDRYKVSTGIFKGFKTFDQLDLSAATIVDERTKIDLKARIDVIESKFKKLAFYSCKDPAHPSCIRLEVDKQREIEKLYADFQKRYNLSADALIRSLKPVSPRRSKDGSTKRSKDGSTKRSKDGSTKRHESTNRSKDGSTKRSKDGSTKRSKHGSTNRSIHGSTNRSIHGSNNRSIHGSTKRSTH